jgi:hypothetical protein
MYGNMPDNSMPLFAAILHRDENAGGHLHALFILEQLDSQARCRRSAL